MNFSTAQEPPYKQTSRGHGSNVISKCKQKYFNNKNQSEESCTEEEDYYPNELPIEDSRKRGRKENSGVETRRKAKGFDSPQVFTPTNDEPESISRQTYCAEVRNCQTSSNRKREIERGFNPPMSYFPHPLILRELMNPTKPTTELPSTSELNKLNPTILNQTFNHPTKMKSRNDESDLFCQHHRHRDHGQESYLDKQKNQMRRRYDQSGEMPRNSMRHSKTTLETENLSKDSTDTTTGTGTTTTGTGGTTTTIATTTTDTSNSFRKFPSSSRRFETGQGQNFSNSTVSNNVEAERNQKKAPRPAEAQKEIVVHDSFLLSSSFQKPQVPSTPGKVKEKLVYVVEEEGQDVKKLETELFSVNEILTIKKDLLELSEFARKLKKLKELKKEPEKGVVTNDPCQCRPVSEVLNEVSKRMEALEARQEQLEKVSEKGKSKKKRDLEKGRKRSGDSKTKGTSNDQIDDDSHPNYDMDLPRMDSLPHGSEIVTELMDLKSQLQKLEKKRLARGVSSDSPHMSDSSPKKKKGHAIAVFSSKTYILAPPGSPSEAHETGGAYDEKKEKKKKVGHSTAALAHDSEDMMNKCIILDTNNPRKIKIETEKTKDDVVNWLNNIPTVEKNQPGNQMDDLAPQRFSTAKDTPESMNQQDNGGLFTCNKCAQVLTDEELKNQEPQKNPKTEENFVEKEVNRSSPKNVIPSAQAITKPYGCKKCYISSLGELYTVENIEAGDCSKNFKKESDWKGQSGQDVSQSSCSTPTAILTKEYIEMVNKKDKITSKLREADFLEFATNPEKVVKTYRNTKTKSLYQTSSPCPGDKKIKETKNEMVKKQSEGDNMKKETKRDLSVSSTTTQSEFMAAIDLDEEYSNEKRKRQKSPYNTPQIFVMKSRNCRFPAYTMVDRKHCKRKRDKRRRIEFCRKPCKRERRCLKRCIRPTPIYKAQCPKKKRRCCYQHEKPRKQYCRERRKVEKCRERNCQSGRRPGRYAEDHHFKPPTACRSRQFKKRLQPCRDNEDPCPKPETSVNYCTERDRNRKSEENVCQIRKFFRDMKGFLPSFSDWNFFAVDRDKKKDSYCPTNQQGRPLQVYYVQTAKVDSQKPRREGGPEHLRKCKCIRQFLRTQETRRPRDWPGSRPFPSTSEPSTTTGLSTSEYSTSSTVSHYYGYETVGRDFLVPVRRPDIYYIDCVPSEKQCAEAIKCEKKKLKEALKECKRRAKKEKCERKEKKKKNKKCVCNICGNVHKKKKDKKGKTCEEKYGKKVDISSIECPPILPDTSEESCCKPKPPECVEDYEEEDDCCEEEEEEEDECEYEVEDECEEEKECQGQPFFSFLKGICSSSKQKPKKSLSTKFRELRYLKTCSSNKSAPSGDSTYSDKPKRRIRYQRSPEPSRRSRHPDMCRCRKKPRKPSCVRPKKCSCPKGCSSASGASGACHCQPILEQIEFRLKYLENRLKNKKKKKKPKDMCGSSCDVDRCSPAYYCVYPQLNRGPEGDAGLQLATEDNRFFLDSKLPSSEGSRIWKKTLKPKLSSLYSFFKYISKHGKEKDERPKMKKSKTDVVNSNDCLLDDLTTVPRLRNIHSLKPEPEHKIKTKEKIKNLMKSKRTIKEKEKTNRKR